jgi:diguanylate cyclase (GGDEF)-like protein
MRNWISLQAELGNFQHRKTIFSFALKMSFLAIILSGFILAVALPSLDFFGLLPLPLPHAVRFGVILSWLVGGTVSGALSLIAGSALHRLTVSRAEFEQLSRTDTLSGLLNRRAFTEALEKVEGDASLVIFDVDRFKAINDRFGHACGDAVITAVSAVLATAFDGGAVARLGGEEFGVIVSGRSLEERMTRIEAVRARIAGQPITADGCDIAITISGGVADLGGERSNQAVYASADKALYLAKALGRNRIVHEREGLRQVLHGRFADGMHRADDGGSRHAYGA